MKNFLFPSDLPTIACHAGALPAELQPRTYSDGNDHENTTLEDFKQYFQGICLESILTPRLSTVESRWTRGFSFYANKGVSRRNSVGFCSRSATKPQWNIKRGAVMELFKASRQWAERPVDERFGSLQEMHAATKHYAEIAKTATVPYSDIRVEAVGEDVQVTGRVGKFAKLTHWAFGQMSRLVSAPSDYLRGLPATLAAQNLNWGLKNRGFDEGHNAQLLFHSNGDLLMRCITSDQYTRIWNHEIVSRLIPLQEYGWRVPPARPAHPNQPGTRPATNQDVLDLATAGLSVKVGDLIAPAGLYASDHDMFAFMVNEKNRINDGSDQGLGRGFFVENSEVGASAFRITTFLYRFVCGNHIVWGAENVREISIRHVGAANTKAWGRLAVEVKRYAESSVGDLELNIAHARKYEIAATKDEVLDKLFNLRIGSRRMLEQAYQVAEENEKVDGAPNTAWGFAQGLTRLSQDTGYADKRTDMDRAAGKVIEIAF